MEHLNLRQRIAELELALADGTSSHNKEIIDLEERIAKLRSSFEKNELLRCRLEYELLLVRKELKNEVRNKTQENEAKKKEIDAFNDELSVKSKQLEAAERLLGDEISSLNSEKIALLNEIKCHKEENAVLENENNKIALDYQKKVEALNKKCSMLEDQLTNKCAEIEYTDNILKDQNMLFEKEKEGILQEIENYKFINANLRLENEKITLTWKKKFDEVNARYMKVEDELPKKVFELKTAEGLFHEKQLQFEKERENMLKEINHHQSCSADWKNLYEELNEKCSLLEGQRIEHIATIHKLVKDNHVICSNEKEWMDKNKDLQEQIKSLVDNIEAERATHLKTKFSTELMELKLQDLEKELATDRACLKECRNNIEESEKKHKALEHLLSSDNAMYKDSMEKSGKKYSELEREYEKQSKEIADQLIVLSNINLEFNGLKVELEEAESKLALNNSSISDTIKELKHLLSNYENKCDINLLEDWTQNTVVNVMRHILRDSKAQIMKFKTNLSATQSSLVKLAAEVETQRGYVECRDKSLEEAESFVKDASNRIEILEKENILLNSQVDQRDEGIKVLIEDVTKAKLDSDQNVESTFATFEVIYDLLVTGAVPPAYSNKLSLNEFKDLVIDEIKINICEGEVKDEKLCKFQNDMILVTNELNHHKESTQKIQEVNANILSQMEVSHQNLLNEKKILQEHFDKKVEEYKKTLNEMELDRNNMIVMYTFIEESLKETKRLNEKISKTLRKTERENKFIMTVNAVITGGLWGLIVRQRSLCMEKCILVNIVRHLFKLKGDVVELTDIINFELKEKDSGTLKSNRGIKGIFRFRATVIAILGAIRFYKIGCYTRTINCTQSGHHNLLFYAIKGGRKKADCELINKDLTRESDLSTWLYNNDMLKNVCLQAVSPLVNVIRDKHMPTPHKPVLCMLVETVSTCYTRYLDSLKIEMGTSSVFALDFTMRKNLIYNLGLGLERILEKESVDSRLYVSVAKVTSNLQETIIDLTKKLQLYKGEMKCMIAERNHYKEERDELKSQVCSQIVHLQGIERELKTHVWNLETQVEQSISADQFEDVCVNLKSGLKREEQLQTLLNEQKREIFEITARVEKEEQSYQQSINLLTMNHQDDYNKLQNKMEDLTAKLSKLETEKEELNILLEKEHGSIEQICLERGLLAEYLTKVAATLHKGNIDVNTLDRLQDTVLPEKVLVSHGKTITREIQICQNSIIALIDSYKDALQHVMGLRKEKQNLYYKINSLEEDATTHRLNVHKLKKQISALCQDDVMDNKHDPSTILTVTETSTPIFVPLTSSYGTLP